MKKINHYIYIYIYIEYKLINRWGFFFPVKFSAFQGLFFQIEARTRDLYPDYELGELLLPCLRICRAKWFQVLVENVSYHKYKERKYQPPSAAAAASSHTGLADRLFTPARATPWQWRAPEQLLQISGIIRVKRNNDSEREALHLPPPRLYELLHFTALRFNCLNTVVFPFLSLCWFVLLNAFWNVSILSGVFFLMNSQAFISTALRRAFLIRPDVDVSMIIL